MRVKLLLFTFYLNGRLHTVSMGRPSEHISNLWTVRFLKSESEPNFGFPHIPRSQEYAIKPSETLLGRAYAYRTPQVTELVQMVIATPKNSTIILDISGLTEHLQHFTLQTASRSATEVQHSAGCSQASAAKYV